MSSNPQLASGGAHRTDAGSHAALTAEAGPFVINLCSSTTPMALGQPESPELKRFSFFVSRRREEGRERFRLHMGYFATLAEAEEWLNAVRDIYPGAWAGEAPGKKLRERAAEAAAQKRAPTSSIAPAPAPAPVMKLAPQPAARGAASRVPNVPTLRAAPPAAAAPKASTPQPAPRAPAQARPTAPMAARGAASAPLHASAPSRLNAAPRPNAAPKPSAPAPAQARTPAQSANAAKSRGPGSNVREVLAALDDSGDTRMMPMPARVQAPANARAPASLPQAPARPAPAPARPQQPRPAATEPKQALSDTQVLRILENRRTDTSVPANDEANAGISLLKPDDTGTRRALEEAIHKNAPVAFAVQLQWSVQPVELDKVPPLAIFSAYTLYTVEGSREGRKWYGLRLGFFSDAISAKQVAYYVRSEFTSVAVVPVSPQEKARASDEEGRSARSLLPKQMRQQNVDEFKLIDDEPRSLPPASERTAAPERKAVPAQPAARPVPGAKRNTKASGRVRAREKRPEKTLEETLEILGASQLEIDNGSGEVLNDTGVRHLRVELQKNTPFSRLLERLSERVKKP